MATLLLLTATVLTWQGQDRQTKYDQIIDYFIDYDTGKLPGAEGKQALEAFNNLGSDAAPALIRGLNRAAKIEHSCPAVTIARKLGRILRASQSPAFLEFARENIGTGVTQSRHMGVIKDLRVVCMLRRQALLVRGVTESEDSPEEPRTSTFQTAPAPRKRVSQMSVAELSELAATAKGLRLGVVLESLGKHKGEEVINALGSSASVHEGDDRKIARDYLEKSLDDLGAAALKEKFKDDRGEIRAAAARVAGGRSLTTYAEPLIELLNDADDIVREAARRSLVRLSRGKDFGAAIDANEVDRKKAIEQWQKWLKERGTR
jgi:hypothetical protein